MTLYYRIGDKHEQDRLQAQLRRDGVEPASQVQRRAWIEAFVGPFPSQADVRAVWHIQTGLGLKAVLRGAQGDVCPLCATKLHGATYEHVVPKSKGGGEDGNVLLAHGDCNGAKRDRWPTGCEIIFLAAANARACAIVANILGSPNERLAWKREKRRRKRLRNRLNKRAALLNASGNDTSD